MKPNPVDESNWENKIREQLISVLSERHPYRVHESP